VVLGLCAMTLATLEEFRSKAPAASIARKSGVVSVERISDVWPDWSTTELSDTELTKVAEKNRPSVVLREAAGAILFSVGLVVLLMTVLGASYIR